MSNLNIRFEHPWLLLLLIPAALLTLIPYFRMTKKYRRTRNRMISITLHLIAMVLAINLLAGISFSYEILNEQNELILLVDVSESNGASRQSKDEFVQTVLNVSDGKYRVGIVKFGYGEVYAAPLTTDTALAYEQYLLSDDPDTTATDLASALGYTKTLFTYPETGKIVVLSDGIETDGVASSVIKAIAAEGITVDTAYFPNKKQDEIQILGVNIPEQHIVVGEPISIELTVRHNLGSGNRDLTLKLFDNGEQLGENATVTVSKENQILPITVTLDERGLHDLRFVMEYEKDSLTQNNEYHTYVNLQVFDSILLIERKENESEKLQALLAEKFNVTAVSLEQDFARIPQTIGEMANYEQVILVNVAYSDMPAGFEALLNEYVYELGGGLFTVGGENDVIGDKQVPHAYNREDIAKSTFYKQMLPVNVIDYTPPIAVMIVIDTSASMASLDLAVKGAEGCLDALHDRDYCGVMKFSSTAEEELQVLPVVQRELILEAIRGIGKEEAGGGTVYSRALNNAGKALSAITNVERKHIILVSDGMPGEHYEEYLPYILENRAAGITMSIIGLNVGNQYEQELINATSEENGGGAFYNVTDSTMNTLPSTMQNDLAMNAIAEIEYGKAFYPTVKDRTAVVGDILDSQLPPLSGYYGTHQKQDAVVPLMGEYVPIYAQWKYGKGNVGSFMSDLNGIWSQDFITNEVGKTVVLNIVSNLFPVESIVSGNVEFALKTDNYTTQINVQSLTKTHSVTVSVAPVIGIDQVDEENAIPVTVAEDGRRFTFEIKTPGLYQIKMTELDGEGSEVSQVVTYQTFSYSEEYNAFPGREPIGEALMTLLSKDGKGIAIHDPAECFHSFAETLSRETDPRVVFLILVILLVLLDIAVRKFKFKWPWELIREQRQRKAEQASQTK